MLFRVCLFFFVVATIAFAKDTSDETDSDIQVYQEAVYILRKALKRAEEWHDLYNKHVPVWEEFEDPTSFTENLAHLAWIEAANYQGYFDKKKATENDQHFIEIAKELIEAEQTNE